MIESIDLSLLYISGSLSIEKHGDGEVLYSDRDKYCHGANLVYLSEPSCNFTEETKCCLVNAPEMIEELIVDLVNKEESFTSRYYADYECDEKEIKKGFMKAYSKRIDLIQRSCNGEKWEDIKEILGVIK